MQITTMRAADPSILDAAGNSAPFPDSVIAYPPSDLVTRNARSCVAARWFTPPSGEVDCGTFDPFGACWTGGREGRDDGGNAEQAAAR